MEYTNTMWIGFNVAVLFLLALDLGVFHRKNHAVGIKEALAWSVFWIALSLGFNYWVYTQNEQAGIEFLTGYLLEKSLSVDNLFVFLLIFSYFKVPPAFQHRVLFLGILGALVMRAVFILLGVALIERFHWLLYAFGLLLIYSGIKMLFFDDDDANPENAVVRAVRRWIPVTSDFHGTRFFVTIDGKRHATPLLIVLVALETTDVLFATDSIPAILGVTQDAFIVYTSNIMAILGLRALYFALASLMDYFEYLRYGLAAVLVFIGVKMLIDEYYKIPTPVALGVLGGLLVISMLASVFFKGRQEEK